MDDSDSIFSEMFRDFREIRESHNKMDEEFRRLCAEPCMKIAEVGDRVIVASGFLGMGHLWVRKEGIVLERGDTSVKVRFPDEEEWSRRVLRKDADPHWIHPNLITDVLGPRP